VSVKKTLFKHHVQIFVPTRDRRGRSLSPTSIRSWQGKVEEVFRRFVRGFYGSPYYTLSGNFLSSDVGWIEEPNYVIEAFASRHVCESLLRALESEVIEPMGVALDQESIDVESTLEGLALYEIHR